jgi:ribonucleoside-diphosphate reductase alpha chain
MTLPTLMQQYIHVSKYARWIEEENRRETWQETVNRYVGNVVAPALSDGQHENIKLIGEIQEAILNLEIMP